MAGKGDQAKGKVKKVVGGAVGNESLKAKGKAEERKGDLRAAKEKILSTAQALIELRGYSALGVAEICKAAGVP
ncbi:CsbD family protein, partial [Streptomyces sp. NPDC006333]|uniref:CsbD family protein n=1 Tax=Streptomyces sp. NPDC006333 TaxID=3156753 RepID=UPI0033BA6E52